ncbi:MAG: 30S ribosome-binding factor RbfA [Motiliproteus sp.]
MAREFSRTHRVAEQLQRDLAQLIQQEVKDPRLGFVTVNEAKVSRDLCYADIYVTVMGKEETAEEIALTIKILNSAAGFLRGRIAKLIKLRIVPQLRFHYDSSVSRGNYLSSLINKAVSEDRQRAADEDDSKPAQDKEDD